MASSVLLRILVFALALLITASRLPAPISEVDNQTPAASAGKYQRTNDGRTYVWNNYPTAGDSASWSGATDSQGYATGYGTLTWYKNGNWASRYAAPMVRGRLNGFVKNQDANGKRFQGTYVNGNKSLDWSEVTEVSTK